MSTSFRLKLVHTSQSAEDLLLSDTIPEHSEFISSSSVFNPVYVPVGQGVEMSFTSEVARSFKSGIIRSLVDSGDLTATFIFGNKVLQRSNGFSVITESTYTVNKKDFYLFVNNANNEPVTITLPEGSTHLGRLRIFDMKGDASTNNITINAGGSDTIGGNASLVIEEDFYFNELICVGTDWSEKDLVQRRSSAPTFDVVTVTSAGTYEARSGQLFEVDATAGDVTVNIQPTSFKGDNIIVKRLDNSANKVQVRSPGDNIEQYNAYDLDSQYDTASFIRGTIHWLLGHEKLASTGGGNTVAEEQAPQGGAATFLVNGDFKTGDLTGWTTFNHTGGSQGPTVHTYDPQTGLFSSAQAFGSQTHYVHGGVGHDGINPHSYIEQSLDVGSSKEFYFSGSLGGQSSQKEEAVVSVTFKNSSDQVIASDTQKTLILSFQNQSQYNGAYTKTSLTGSVDHNGNYVFSTTDTDKPIWLMRAGGMDSLIIYNKSFGSTQWVALQLLTSKFEDLVDGFNLGTENSDWTDEVIQTNEGDLIDGYYYPNDSDITASYDVDAIRHGQYMRWNGSSYETRQDFSESSRMAVPAGASTADFRVTFEKTDGSTSLDIDGTATDLRLLWFPETFSDKTWSAADSSDNMTLEMDGTMAAFSGSNMTGVAVTPEFTSGKWYFECNLMLSNGTDDGPPAGNVDARIGVVDATYNPTFNKNQILGAASWGSGYSTLDGNVYTGGTGLLFTNGQAESDGAIFSIAVDSSTGNVWIGRPDGASVTWVNDGDPELDSNPTFTLGDASSWRLAFGNADNGNSCRFDVLPGQMNMITAPTGFNIL
jgi:hypothetical protein